MGALGRGQDGWVAIADDGEAQALCGVCGLVRITACDFDVAHGA